MKSSHETFLSTTKLETSKLNLREKSDTNSIKSYFDIDYSIISVQSYYEIPSMQGNRHRIRRRKSEFKYSTNPHTVVFQIRREEKYGFCSIGEKDTIQLNSVFYVREGFLVPWEDPSQPEKKITSYSILYSTPEKISPFILRALSICLETLLNYLYTTENQLHLYPSLHSVFAQSLLEIVIWIHQALLHCRAGGRKSPV